MTVAARKTTRRKAKPASESSVYDGSTMCGIIVPKAGAFVARLASGKSIGRFADERSAMRAITAAARGTSQATTQPASPAGMVAPRRTKATDNSLPRRSATSRSSEIGRHP